MFSARKQPALIAPSQVGASIVQLVENARKHLILISPYFNPWKHLNSALKAAVERGVEITLIIRTDQIEESMQHISPLGIDARHIDRLHAKLYLSEKSAIMTSMNLVNGSRDSWESGLLIAAAAKLYPTLAAHIQEQFVARSDLVGRVRQTGYLEQSHFDTLTLLQRGMSDEQIAAERGLKVSTIRSHFEAIAAARRYPIEKLVDPTRVSAIRTALGACGANAALGDIKAYLAPDTTTEYWEIAAVRNYDGNMV